MKKVKLGSSNLEVSEVCLGSMTWGQQNTQAEGKSTTLYHKNVSELQKCEKMPNLEQGSWFQEQGPFDNKKQQ